MATYEKYRQNISRQEGNLADIVVEVTNLDFSESEVSLQVRDKNDELLFEKTTLDSETADDIDISSDGTIITIVLQPDDTKGRAGIHQYEIDIMDDQERPYVTIGGVFTINPEINDR